MSYGFLFDGDEHWLGEGYEEGWVKPYMHVTDVVLTEPQPKGQSYEGPLTNIVSVPVSGAEQTAWAVEQGWSAFAVMARYIGELMSPGGDNLLDVEQRVVRNAKWEITSTHYRVMWKGDDIDGI